MKYFFKKNEIFFLKKMKYFFKKNEIFF